MFDAFFEKYPEYVTIQLPTEDVLNSFKGKLPAQLTDFWKAYGFGIFMKGYLKVVDPSEYQQAFDEAYDNKNSEIVFGVTAFGDFLTWTGDAIRAVYFKNGGDSIIESGDDLEWFFDMDLADEGFLRDNLDDRNYLPAKEMLGELEFDECYGFVPLIGLGGAGKVDHLERVKIKEHISIIAQTMGKIK
ncbi:T6SS immunity protein Tdi1 domain-containing protein [Pedobacter sp. B4-66]|uniref:T6SS immunity protein Tdi1 domain-containing protein n=1 Tax=Pedobacter sp. B4-66 TaxID=2817280 RepID=UPI001BDA1B64|nr:T6SS immunity protein Tdi1 domain-containing protein [Pedobacter sp. B4-66]